ncbi:MAG: DsbA family protein [Longimicrobiaceae bacterium]
MSRNETTQNLLTGVLVLCALVITGLLVRRELWPAAQPGAAPPAVTQVDDWVSYASAGRRTGPAPARVTIVEFSDFQCPFCARLAPRLDSLRERASVPVAVVYRHYPLESHPHAMAAARASECAAEQGRFKEMHDALFREQGAIGQKAWSAYARDAGVPDSAAFARCLEGDAGSARIRADVAAGDRLGVTGTPTVLVNRYRMAGAPPLDTLLAYVRRAANEAPQ